MEQSLLVLQALLPVLCIVGLGAFLRTRSVLKPEMEHGLTQLVVHVLLPALTIVNIVGNAGLADVANVLTVVGFGFGMTALSFFVAYKAAGVMGMKRGSGKRTFGVAAGLQNYGFMGIPLLVALFDGDRVLGVLFTHNVGVGLAVWTVGVALMSGGGGVSWKILLKGPIVSVFVGLLLNFSGGQALLDGAPRATLQMLGDCAIPVALLVIGASLVDSLKSQRFDWKVGFGAVVVRLALIPAVMLGLAHYLPLSELLRQVIVIQAAMPAAMFPIVLAKHYGGKPELAVQVVVSTTVMCFFTVPIMIVIGMKVLGLPGLPHSKI